MNVENEGTLECIRCKQPITFDNVFTKEGWAEVAISNTCEVCFDNILLGEISDNARELGKEFEAVGMAQRMFGAYIGGGVLRKAVNKQDEVMDIDVFFRDEQVSQQFMEELVKAGYDKVFTCPLGELHTYKKEGQPKVQLITKFYYNSVREMVDTFDLTACCAGLDGDDFVCNRRFISDVKNKKIYFNQITFPVATLNRISKYVLKGFTLPASSNVFFIETVNNMVLDNDNMVYYVD